MNYYDDYDPGYSGDPYSPQSHHPQPQRFTLPRPWSPANDSSFGDDGGAIARYLETQNQAAPSTNRGVPGYIARSTDYRSFNAHSRHQRQETSESVEALDLADYSNTLGRRAYQQMQDEYVRQGTRQGLPQQLAASASHSASPHSQYPPPPEGETYSQYPVNGAARDRLQINIEDDPPSPLHRPYSAQSRGTFGSRHTRNTPRTSTPSQSSNSHSRCSPRQHVRTVRTTARHLSLPPALPTPNAPAIWRSGASNSNRSHAPTPPPRFDAMGQDDADVQQFPKWSRGWYDTTKPHSDPPMYHQEEADIGVWPPQAAPNFPQPNTFPRTKDSGLPPLPDEEPAVLPWGRSASGIAGDPPQYVPESVKEERMRMLEREFGGKGKGKEREWDGQGLQLGSVNEEGELVTDHPKRRAILRWLQTLFALVAAGSAIYGAMSKHPKPPAPAASKPAAYILYGLSVITFIFTIWLFHLRPCCRRRKRRKRDPFTQGKGPGMMVLPVMQGLNGGKKGKPKKGKKGKHAPGDSVQVNLIVDPTMFGGGQNSRRDEEEGEDDEWDDEGRSNASRRKGPKPRRSVFQAVAMEKDWKSARTMVKWRMFADVMLMIIWAGEFFWILWSARCSGGYDGWCTTYNIAVAIGFLLSLLFAISVYYDIRDLTLSKQSPRTR